MRVRLYTHLGVPKLFTNGSQTVIIRISAGRMPLTWHPLPLGHLPNPCLHCSPISDRVDQCSMHLCTPWCAPLQGSLDVTGRKLGRSEAWGTSDSPLPWQQYKYTQTTYTYTPLSPGFFLFARGPSFPNSNTNPNPKPEP